MCRRYDSGEIFRTPEQYFLLHSQMDLRYLRENAWVTLRCHKYLLKMISHILILISSRSKSIFDLPLLTIISNQNKYLKPKLGISLFGFLLLLLLFKNGKSNVLLWYLFNRKKHIHMHTCTHIRIPTPASK